MVSAFSVSYSQTKMKKLFSFNKLAIAMVALLSVGFVSCGDDDENVTPAPNNGEEVAKPEDNLPEKTRAFVGYWRNSQTDSEACCDFLFLPDGKCLRYRTSDGSFIDEGYWTFDENTNILATTVGGWQWQVTLSNSATWAGFSIASSTTQSYNRDDARYALYFIQNTNWVCGEEYQIKLGTVFMSGIYESVNDKKYWATKNVAISFGSNEFPTSLTGRSNYLSEGIYMELKNVTFTGSTFTADYKIYDKHRWCGLYNQTTDKTYYYSKYISGSYSVWYYCYTPFTSGTITVKNYYTKNNATLTLSGAPDHEYSLVQ